MWYSFEKVSRKECKQLQKVSDYKAMQHIKCIPSIFFFSRVYSGKWHLQVKKHNPPPFKKKRRVFQPPIRCIQLIRCKAIEANWRKENGTETREINNGSTLGTRVNNLLHTFSRDTGYSCCSIQKDEEENINMQHCWRLIMDLSSSAEKPEKSLSVVSDRNRDKKALSDWEFLVTKRDVIIESLDLWSALKVSKFYFNHKYGTNSR